MNYFQSLANWIHAHNHQKVQEEDKRIKPLLRELIAKKKTCIPVKNREIQKP